jgi:hypothetical protein
MGDTKMKHFRMKTTEGCIDDARGRTDVICYDVQRREWLFFWALEKRFNNPQEAEKYRDDREKRYNSFKEQWKKAVG